MHITSDDKAIETLNVGGNSVDDYVLVGNEGRRFSICIGHPRRGITTLIVEHESENRAIIAFLIKREARQYSTMIEFADAIGWDRISRFDEA
jgi:hypothetical protein